MTEVDNSVKSFLTERRKKITADNHFDIPVPGYEDRLVARYATLDWHRTRAIGMRQENEPDKILAEVNMAADTLTNACIDLLIKKDDGTLASTGYTWNTQTARELFGAEEHELVQGTAREAILMIFPSDTSVVMHFSTYSELSSKAQTAIEAEVQGESEATSVA